MSQNEMELDALYAAWSEDQASRVPKPLKEWTQAYPNQAQDMVLWASAEPILHVAEERSAYSVSIEQTLAIGASVLTEQRAKIEANLQPLQSLVAVAKKRGLSVKALAQQVGIGVTLIAKLQDRLLVANSVPNTLLERLSQLLEVTTEQICAYLQLPPQLAKGAMFKSSDVPRVGEQQTFEKAVEEALEMSAEQKAFWKQ